MTPVEIFMKSIEVRHAIEYIMKESCVILKIAGGEETVCNKMISTMGDYLMPALARGLFSKDRICNEFLHLC